MHEEAARKLIKETFNQSYSHDRFRKFIRELTKNYEDRNTSGQVPNNFKDSIKSVFRVGKYVDAERNEIEILAVTLAKDTSLDRARTLQRNFVAHHLSDHDKEAALVAFVSPDSNSWRFSLVRRELSLTRSFKGKTKAGQDFSPARRFSFLVGENEHTHTAQRQLIDLLKSDNRPSLKTLEKAFNIEQVTEEFFEEYRELFNRVNEKTTTYLKDHPDIQAHFIERDIEPADFAKRLLGQIVFLYFLQKKGWLGVPRKAKWGEGSRTFLRDLYNKAESEGKNFFDSYLKHLFYDALNHDRSDVDHYYSMFDCRIPFLNGGLFEPYHDYKWEQWDIKLPNTLFHERGSSLFGEDGKGILDVFDRYNFTVAEDEPLEREVAIDPEMLGKVFEKLLPVKERGKLGTFYTPREIVHYMCQESLIAYLFSHFPMLDKSELDDFIRHCDLYLEHDATPQAIRDQAKKIDEVLANIKVCDPAIGSGAFPVGMMVEIIRIRKVIGLFLSNQVATNYELKRQTIQNCLYGVDLDPGAIEIAKLRLWLSLVVDEDNFDQIQALPNLDYKIMQGNSLLQSYEGIKLFEDALLKQHDHTAHRRRQLEAEFKEMQDRFMTFVTGSASMSNQRERNALEKALREKKKEIDSYLEKAKTQEDTPLFAKVSKAVELAERLKKLHHDFFDTDRPKKKKELKAEIETLEWQLIETSLREKNKADKIPDIQKLQRHNVKPYFLWKLHFNEVFAGDNGGFDIVIANPPYVFARESKKKGFSQDDKKTLYESYKLAEYQVNLYPLFIELSSNILRADGSLCLITPNNWMTINTNKTLRRFVLEQQDIKIVNFYAKVFATASVDSSIIIFRKGSSNKKISLYEYTDDFHLIANESTDTFSKKIDAIINIEALKNNNIPALIEKIEMASNKLNDISIVKSGLQAYEVGKGIPSLTKEMKDARIYHANTYVDESYIKYLDGKDVCRYYLSWSGEYLKYGSNLASPRNMALFSGKRILVRQIPSKPPYCIHATFVEDIILNDRNSMNVIELRDDPFYMLAILNSRLVSFWFEHKFGKLQRGVFPQFKINELKIFPLPKTVSKEKKNLLIQLALTAVRQKQISSKADVTALDRKIDEEVYRLYHLTDAEIALIEQAVPG